MEPPSPIQALGAYPFPSRFIIRQFPGETSRADGGSRANHNDEMTLLLYNNRKFGVDRPNTIIT